jgi:hypothetical protein
MARRKRFLHPDDPHTRAEWFMVVILLAEAAVLLWVLGVIRPLG